MAMGPALLSNNSLIQPLTHAVVANGEQRLRGHTLADVAHAGVQVADMPEKGARMSVYDSESVNTQQPALTFVGTLEKTCTFGRTAS